ncbi:histone H1-like [Coregonus clupeaformis]|uniref:histone H1-like n=1 Tax=Coregonus clupeaformis TaxID=59861 RepID=UPI001E1C3524|nr:histone H1-like [Coregonus clupeaformis]
MVLMSRLRPAPCSVRSFNSAEQRLQQTSPRRPCVYRTKRQTDMAEVAPAPAAAAPAKAPKKKAAPKPKKAGPSVGELIVKAVTASQGEERRVPGALKKTLAAGGYDVEKNNSRVKIAVKSLVTKGTLVQTKGTGASGSFKLNKKAVEAKRPAKKAAVPKVKKVAAKKPAAAKKPKKVAAKKAVAAKKSPKKAKKPATPKKAAKSPKKVKKRRSCQEGGKEPQEGYKGSQAQSRQAQGSQGQEGSPQEEVNLLQTVFYSTHVIPQKALLRATHLFP